MKKRWSHWDNMCPCGRLYKIGDIVYVGQGDICGKPYDIHYCKQCGERYEETECDGHAGAYGKSR